jgi:hypothetical protein
MRRTLRGAGEATQVQDNREVRRKERRLIQSSHRSNNNVDRQERIDSKVAFQRRNKTAAITQKRTESTQNWV